MTEPLTEREQELIERWVVDPLLLSSEEIHDLDNSTSCRKRMSELIDCQRSLDSAGETAILDLVAEARDMVIPAAPGFDAALAAAMPARAKSKPRWLVWLAVAALLPLCLWAFGLWHTGDAPPMDRGLQELGIPSDLEVQWDGDRVSWQAQSDTVSVTVRVFKMGERRKLLSAILAGSVSSWTPTDEQRAKMGDQFRVVISIEFAGATGKLQGECRVTR